MKNIHLVVVAHPDDEILGFGGSGLVFANKNEPVYALILSANAEARNSRPNLLKLKNDILNANKEVNFQKPILGQFPNIRFNNVDHLDLVRFIEKHIKELNATHIYTHFPNDLNNDHHHVSLACQAAARLFQRKDNITEIKQICLMEISSSTEWSFPINGSNFSPNYFVDITNTIDKKINALKCYQNVIRDVPHPRSIEVIKSLARFRGSQSASKFAEAFQIIYQK